MALSAFLGRFPSLRAFQDEVISAIGDGRDLVLSAGTGSGKTEAVVAPLVDRFLRGQGKPDKTFLIYVCPTKALVNDILLRLRPTLDTLGLRIAVRHGDRNELARRDPPHVIVTTPESLGILMHHNDQRLRTVQSVILDEAHLLYNTQRGAMAAILLRRLRLMTELPVQAAILSATLGCLDDIRRFLLGENSEAALIHSPGTRELDAVVRGEFSLKSAAKVLSEIVARSQGKVLVFANSRQEVEATAAHLTELQGTTAPVFVHHSSLAPVQRESVERGFSDARSAICIATSTLEMGIDIGDIDLVCLVGPPPDVECLLQRIGRGSRRSHKTNVVCFPTSGATSLDLAVFSAMLRLAQQGRLPDRAPETILGAVGQQCLAVILKENGAFTSTRRLVEIVSYRADVDRPKVEAILEGLALAGYLQKHVLRNSYGADEGLWNLKKHNLVWGNFPISSITVDVVNGDRFVGSLPYSNLTHLRPGVVFRLGNRAFTVSKIVERRVIVLEGGRGGQTTLNFEGDTPEGPSSFLASTVWSWLFAVTPENSFLSKSAWKIVEPLLSVVRVTLEYSDVPYVKLDYGFRVFTFAGCAANRVLAHWVGGGVRKYTGFYLESDRLPDFSRLPESARQLKDYAAASYVPTRGVTLFQRALPIALRAAEWLDEWLSDRDVDHVLARLRRGTLREVGMELFAPLDGVQ